MAIQSLRKIFVLTAIFSFFTLNENVRIIKSEAEGIVLFVNYLPIVSKSGYWEPVGPGPDDENGISHLRGYASVPSIAIAADGTPYVTWSEFDGVHSEVYVRRWNGSIWEEVGSGSGSGGGISHTGSAGGPVIAIAPDGTPYVAWNDTTNGNPEIYIRQWDGTTWIEVGNGSATGGGITNTESLYPNLPKIGFAPDGTLYVVWQEDLSSWPIKIYALQWNGSVWEEVGAGSASGAGISNTTRSSSNPSLTVTPDGTLYVGWETYGDTLDFSEIYVRRWNGNIWEEVGTGSASGGGISNTPTGSAYPVITSAANGTIFVAWEDQLIYGVDSEVYVKSWDGTSWLDVGETSASNGGISDDLDDSIMPTIGAGAYGIYPPMPYVIWSNRQALYLRRWNGNTWAEVGLGSASGGGLAGAYGIAVASAIVVAPDQTVYIGWSCMDDEGLSEIYVARFVP